MHEGLLRAAWAAVCAALLGLLVHPATAVEIDPNRGRLGFTVYVEVDGSYAKPILKSVRVQEIEPGSPAEVGGLKVEDLILQAQGKPLAGADAREVASMVQVPPGRKLHLVVRSTDGAQRHVTIVAGPSVSGQR
jgi:C-terminal processing protease CtpA/Prc